MSIDSRLVDFNGADEERLVENFNRILAIIDALPTGGGVDPDITINAEATYDSNKGEWDVSDLEVTLKDGTELEDIVDMLTETNNTPVCAGGIKVTTETEIGDVSVTSLPSSYFVTDVFEGAVCFTMNHFSLGTLIGVLAIEEEEYTLVVTKMS